MIIVDVHGLHDPEADLILEGRCTDCEAVLFRRRYRQEDRQHMTEAQISAEGARDARQSMSHRCPRPS